MLMDKIDKKKSTLKDKKITIKRMMTKID